MTRRTPRTRATIAMLAICVAAAGATGCGPSRLAKDEALIKELEAELDAEDGAGAQAEDQDRQPPGE